MKIVKRTVKYTDRGLIVDATEKGGVADIYPAHKVIMFVMLLVMIYPNFEHEYRLSDKRKNASFKEIMEEYKKMIAAYVLSTQLFNSICAVKMITAWNTSISNGYVYRYKLNVRSGNKMDESLANKLEGMLLGKYASSLGPDVAPSVIGALDSPTRHAYGKAIDLADENSQNVRLAANPNGILTYIYILLNPINKDNPELNKLRCSHYFLMQINDNKLEMTGFLFQSKNCILLNNAVVTPSDYALIIKIDEGLIEKFFDDIMNEGVVDVDKYEGGIKEIVMYLCDKFNKLWIDNHESIEILYFFNVSKFVNEIPGQSENHIQRHFDAKHSSNSNDDEDDWNPLSTIDNILKK